VITRTTQLGPHLAQPLSALTLTGQPGPMKLTVFGGIHGDEPEGALSIYRLAERLETADFTGEICLIPVAHPSAWNARARNSPEDGKNLARCFPGSSDGTVTERLAQVLTEMIGASTFLLDLHSAGRDYAMPFFAGAISDGTICGNMAAAAAKAFGAPLVWLHGTANPGRSISAAAAAGVPAVYVETGGRGSLRRADLEAYVDGVLRTMIHLEMASAASLQFDEPSLSHRVINDGDGNIDDGIVSPAQGWCATCVEPGEVVQVGDLLGEVIEASTGRAIPILAERDGVVALARHTARISVGDVLFLLAPPPSTSEHRGGFAP
jgi:uncharacterized protein